MTIDVANNQKIKKIKINALRRGVRDICRILDISDCKLSLLICDDRYISGLNKKFFNKRYPTDVIAFPLREGNYLGEVAVSLERAVAVCAEYGNTWQEEFTLYLVHGILHLLGYEDKSSRARRIMEKKQFEVVERLSCLPV